MTPGRVQDFPGDAGEGEVTMLQRAPVIIWILVSIIGMERAMPMVDDFSKEGADR